MNSLTGLKIGERESRVEMVKLLHELVMTARNKKKRNLLNEIREQSYSLLEEELKNADVF